MPGIPNPDLRLASSEVRLLLGLGRRGREGGNMQARVSAHVQNSSVANAHILELPGQDRVASNDFHGAAELQAKRLAMAI